MEEEWWSSVLKWDKIKRREVVDGARRIRSEKLRDHKYREGCAKSLVGKREE